MAKIIEMPKLSDTMTEGVIAAWHKKVGEKVKQGELLAEIETDKATMEMESFFDGILLYVAVENGGGVTVGGLLAIVGNAGEDIQPILEDYKEKAKAAAISAETKDIVDEKQKEEIAVPLAQVVNLSAKTGSSGSSNGDGRQKVSPLAKALAKEKGLDLKSIPGTGEGGRIIKRDIEEYVEKGGTATRRIVAKESFTEVPLSQMRKTIARRLVESKNTAPHFYLTMEISMDTVFEAREAINQESPVKISFNDIIIKAVAAAIRRNPKVNASWMGDKIRYNDHIHIGMAVAIDEGLIVPVIRYADLLTLAEISQASRSLAEKARKRELQPQDWEGNTFTISNLGMFGIEEFTAIINPPDACILAIGGIQQKPVIKSGQIVPGRVMKVTLSCDHRVVDGSIGSVFLNNLKDYLENPIKMFV